MSKDFLILGKRNEPMNEMNESKRHNLVHHIKDFTMMFTFVLL